MALIVDNVKFPAGEIFGELEPLRDTATVNLEDLGDEFQVRLGQRLRFVAVDSAGVFPWSDTAQENADDFADELIEAFTERGVVLVRDRVRGEDLGDGREAYLIELEVAGFVLEPLLQFVPIGAVGASIAAESVGAQIFRAVVSNLGLAIVFGTALVIDQTVSRVTEGPAPFNTLSLVALAAGAVAVVYILSRAKA